jgi:hypothetical protein
MTAGGVEVDLDRLADFVGGALDGTPDAADVRHLVTTDPGWADAYAALVSADAAVRGQLNALGSEAPAVPDDVLHRLDAALAGAKRPELRLVPQQRDELAERRQRRRRWTVRLAAAAAVLVCAAGGVAVLRSAPYDQNATSSSDAGGQAAAPPKAAAPLDSGAATAYSSGTDYTADSLRELPLLGGLNSTGKSPAAMTENDDSGPGSAPLQAREPTAVPDGLARLQNPAIRAECVAAILAAYGGRVVLIDYARFQGAPALVVLMDGASFAAGSRGAVVVGPQCGTNNTTDERFKLAL